MAMRKTMHAAAALCAAMSVGFALSGCPTQPSYASTITPIYAATSANGLFVYNGTNWTNYTTANTGSGLASSTLSSVVISSSGAGAIVLAGGNAGVSEFNGSAWAQLATGLGALPVNSLIIGTNLYASTAGGISILNADGTTWTNNGSVTPVNDVYSLGTYTFVAADAGGLYVYNGTSQQAPSPYSPGTIVSGSGSVTAVVVDSSMDIFAGTDKGLGISGSAIGLSFGTNQLPVSTHVYNLYIDTSGNLYAATAGGLYIYNLYGAAAPQGFLDMPAYCVCVDGAGTIYAGTDTGLRVSTNGGSSWTMKLPTRSLSD
jgi:ligand-binding sensor domain-containing protein